MTLPMRDCDRCCGAGVLLHATSAGHDWDESPCPAGCDGGEVVDEDALCVACGEAEGQLNEDGELVCVTCQERERDYRPELVVSVALAAASRRRK